MPEKRVKGAELKAQSSHQPPKVERDTSNAIKRILVVDDSRAQRRVLAAQLGRQGFEVLEADGGEAALEIARTEQLDLVLSDWMMPGMDGLEFCREFRALSRENYGYFILLTSKSEKGAVAQGLDVGADDFLNKPVNGEELRARIAAGDRILKMERELNEKNRLISSTLSEISALYDAVDRDLIEARKMQQSLVRDRFRDFGPAEVSLILKPCGHVGGDLVGYFRAGEGKIAVYGIDVSGHGIASALLTARIASYFSDGSVDHNIALIEQADGTIGAKSPAQVASALNDVMLKQVKSDLYFTMVLAYIDTETGEMDAVQCGHPNPVVIGADGSASYVGQGGLPIGLIEDATFEDWQIQLDPGARVLLYSDGFTECENPDGIQLEEDGFKEILERNAKLHGNEFLEALVWDLDGFAQGQDFGDDLSCVSLAFRGPGAAPVQLK
ncbi:MAG: PP2C family protein-serine/threonine phosphatase [Maritimibacter sp.]